MKLLALHVCRVDANKTVFMASKSALLSFGYFERKTIRELGNFIAREVFFRIKAGQQEIIMHNNYHFHALRWSDGLGVSALTDKDYPSRIAFELLTHVHNDFRQKISRQIWQNIQNDFSVPYKDNLNEWIQKYKNPLEFDSVSLAISKVEETKGILRMNIEQILGNQEQIEKLVNQSEDVSGNFNDFLLDFSNQNVSFITAQSELMFKAAKKANKGCCRLQ